MDMNENIKEQVRKASSLLGMNDEEGMEKFMTIVTDNNLTLPNDEALALSLWRQYFMSAKTSKTTERKGNTGSLVKKCFGFFISMDEARNINENLRNRLLAEYRRDANATLSSGKIAIAEEQADGKFNITRYHNDEEQQITKDSMPSGNVEVEDGVYLIALDNNKTKYNSMDKNPSYGSPLPEFNWRRSGIFVGKVDGGDVMVWNFSYRNEACKNFNAGTFNWVHFDAIPNDNQRLNGFTDGTYNSLKFNTDLDTSDEMYIDVSSQNFVSILAETNPDKVVTLMELERVHQQNQMKDWGERYVITDGSVVNINMKATSNGNRILSITDLNSDFDYEGDSWGSTTCWVPSEMNIDFGIGSQVLIVGRTSQGTDENGMLRPVSINVSGLYVLERRGSVSFDVPQDIEEDTDWFTV